MKRLFFLVVALLCCTSSVFAWNAESFTNGVYEYEPVLEASTFSLNDGVAVAAPSESLNFLTWNDIYPNISLSPLMGQIKLSIFNSSVGMSLPYLYPDSGFSLSRSTSHWSNTDWVNYHGSVSVPDKVSGGPVESCSNFFAFDGSSIKPFYFNIDISSLGSFSSFSLSGSISCYYEIKNGSNSILSSGNCNLSLYVNGDPVKTWVGTLDNYQMSDFLFTSTVPITSISFGLTCEPQSFTFDSGTLKPIIRFGSSDFRIDVLRDNSVLDGFNDQAQDSINEHESIESQWTGSMTENFNSLDLESFTFPNGLVAAFALITGIFQDLWNGMGDYKILYVFPLTLAIALLLVGRISKFAGNSGSGRNKGGDDGA